MRITAQIRKAFLGVCSSCPRSSFFCCFYGCRSLKGSLYSFYHIDFVKGNTFAGLDNYNDDIFTIRKYGSGQEHAVLHGPRACDRVLGADRVRHRHLRDEQVSRLRPSCGISALRRPRSSSCTAYGDGCTIRSDRSTPRLTSFGIGSVSVHDGQGWSMISIVIMETWQSFGSAMLIYLAAFSAFRAIGTRRRKSTAPASGNGFAILRFRLSADRSSSCSCFSLSRPPKASNPDGSAGRRS